MDSEGCSDKMSMRGMAGLSSQSPWYHDRDKPAVTEAWLQARLGEVLAARGQTVEAWLRVVQSMVHSSTSGPASMQHGSHAPELHVWTPDQHECLATFIRLVRIQSTTRQYNYDHQYDWDSDVWAVTDVLKRSLTAIDDCDGASAATYAVAMTILFPPRASSSPAGGWKSPEIRALRQLGAIVGFPCGVTGTSGPSDTCLGHMYCAFIPCVTFCRAIFADDGPLGKDTEIMCKRFAGAFGFPPPRRHTKPSVCESIYYTTPYYSDHVGTSEAKKQASRIVQAFVDEMEGGPGVVDWVHYATTQVMDRENQAQDYAIRLFTDVLDHLYKRSEAFPSAIRAVPPLGTVGLGVMGRCRSFLFFLPKAESEKDVDDLFPGTKKDPGIQSRIAARLAASHGYGLPIELLGHGRPGFQLHATMKPMEPRLANMEKRIIDAYEHPIVALPAQAADCFAKERDWMRVTIDELTKLCREGGVSVGEPVPKDSNDRVTLFVYDYYTAMGRSALATRIIQLCKDLGGANKVAFCKYGWSIACVFSLK